jgi:hypothetical protein
MVFAGKYIKDTDKLAATGMACIVINLVCMSVVYGMSSVLETFVS